MKTLFLQLNTTLVQNNRRINNFSLAVEKLSFSWIFTHMENCFFYFLNPLINFQEINLYWKTFLFLQLNITSVQNHWRIYFLFSSGKRILNFLNFTHREKLLFYFSFEPICIFNLLKRKNRKCGLILLL